MGDLVYMFASLAARCTNGVTCLDGMHLLAETLHPHGVKITWIVSPGSARIAAIQLTQWHEQWGDDVALEVPPLEGSADAKKAQIAAARREVVEALPWSPLTIAGGGHREPGIAALLEDVGFEGLWGFCWEQIEVDEITDRGCPWGLYYMDREERLRPAPGRGVVGMEWTARDLLKSFHCGNPTLYSTDPNDVARGGLCSWEDVDYLKGMARNYIRNTRFNGHVFLLQHQEAHEMERSEHYRCYTKEDVAEAAVMLDAFAGHIKDKARMMTLAEAAALYREQCPATASSYMLWEDTPTRPYNRDYAWSLAVGPWPRTFLYYDRGAQMMFIDGQVHPVCIRNYARAWKGGEYFEEPRIPCARLVKETHHSWSRELEFTVDSPADMPYGLALWGDYALCQIGKAEGLVEGKILSHDLLFLRYDIRKGNNAFRVCLEGK